MNGTGKTGSTMDSREKILAAIKKSQPALVELVKADQFGGAATDGSILTEQYIRTLQSIGGHGKIVSGYDEIISALKHQFPEAKRIVSTLPELKTLAEIYQQGEIILAIEDIDVAILPAHFGVAENGSVWLTEDIMCDRVLPFICQHLVVVIDESTIVSTMHDAYKRISTSDYGFSIFIAGPSKTADIEQSLVLGAHGPLSMTVFIK